MQVQGLGFRVQGLGFRAWGLRLRGSVIGLGFKGFRRQGCVVWSLRFRVGVRYHGAGQASISLESWYDYCVGYLKGSLNHVGNYCGACS